MKRLLLFVCFLLFTQSIVAQLLTRTTQPFENHIRQNPAMVHYGFHHPSNRYDEPYLLAGIYHRTQWLGDHGGLEGMNTAGAYMSTFLEEHRVGYGAYFARDKIGPMKSNTAQGHFSYAILNKYSKVTFGIGLGYAGVNLERKKIEFHPDSHNSIADLPVGQHDFTASFGVYYLQEIKWGNYLFASLSLPRAIIDTGRDTLFTIFRPTTHFSGSFGFLLPLNEDLKIEPYCLVQGTFDTKVLVALGGRLSFKNIWLGAGANTTGSFYAEVGCEIPEIGNKDSVGRLSFTYDSAFFRDAMAQNLGNSLEFHLVYWIQNGIF